jgi:photosystem II stability/assembly factor-like uncharacterized protein
MWRLTNLWQRQTTPPNPYLRPIPRTLLQRVWRIACWLLLAYLLIVGMGVASTHEMFAHELQWQAQEIPVGMFPAGNSPSITSLIFAPDGMTLYVGTGGGGVFRSADGGENWEPVNNGLTNLNVQTILFSPTGETLYAGTTGEMFRSTDGGVSWEPANNGLGGLGVLTLLFSPTGETLYAGTWRGGLFHSNDGGDNWQSADNGLFSGDVRTLLVSPTGETLYAGTARGVFRSTDGGTSWKYPANNGLTNLNVHMLIFSPMGETLYAGTWRDGIFRSSDGGANWEPANSGLTSLRVQTLLFSPTGETLYAGTNEGGVFRSSDGGASWEPANNGLTNLNVQMLLFSPTGETLYAGTGGGGVFRSADGGEKWEPANSGLTNLVEQRLLFSPTGDTLYAHIWGSGVFRSADGGANWEPANNGLTNLDVRTLHVSPTGDTLYTGTDGGIFRSNDGGENWEPANNGLTNLDVRTLHVSPTGDTLYAHIRGSGVFRSADGGANWEPANNGLTNLDVWTLYVSPTGETLYAHILGSGVFRSADGGANWEPVNVPLSNLPVFVLRFSPTGETIYADGGPVQGGLLISNDGGANWTVANEYIDWSFLRANEYQLVVDGQQRLALHASHLLAPVPWALRGQGTAGVAVHIDSTNQTAKLVRLASIRQLLRASDVPLPLIYRFPPFLRDSVLIALPLPAWLQTNWFNLLVAGLVMLVATYLFVIRPNRLSAPQIGYLVRQPGALFSSNGFGDFSVSWAKQPTLAQLLVLLAPTKYQFQPAYLVQRIIEQGGETNATEVADGLYTWAEDSRLFSDVGDGWWVVRRPTFVALQQRDVPARRALPRLLEATHTSDPRFRHSIRFLEEASLAVENLAANVLRATTTSKQWAHIPALLVITLWEQPLSRATLEEWVSLAQTHLPSTSPRHLVAIINQPLRDSDTYHLLALQSQEDLVIIPLPYSIIQQAQFDPTSSPAHLLRHQIELYTGQANLYDFPAAVSDVLSFFGRQTPLTELKQKLHDGRPIMLYGVRKMGKSSLIKRFCEESSWPSAVVDLQGFSGHLEGVYGAALTAWGQVIPLRYPEQPWEAELFTLPATTSDSPARAFRQRVEQILGHLSEAHPTQPPGLLLLLDEMEYFLADSPEQFMSVALTLREIAQSSWGQGRFGLLMAGLDPTINRIDQYHGQRNPFFAFFRNLPLPPLEIEDTAEMITSIGGQMGLRYDEEAVAYLAQVGGGHPYLTRQLCSLLYEHLQANQPANAPLSQQITLEMAEQAVARYLRNPLNYLDASLWQSSPPDVQTLLRLLAHGQADRPEALLAAFVAHGGERRAGLLALQQLQDESLVRETAAGQLQFTIPLYQQYLQTITEAV